MSSLKEYVHIFSWLGGLELYFISGGEQGVPVAGIFRINLHVPGSEIT